MLIRLITATSYWLSMAAALSALVRYRRLAPALRLVALLACFDAATEVVSSLFHDLLPTTSNLFILPVSVGGEGLLLTLAYRRALAAPRLGRALLGALAAYLAFVLAEAWRRLGTVQYYVATQVLSNLLMLGLAGLYFRKLLHEPTSERLHRDPFFWLSVGLAFYALGNLPIVLSADYVLAHYSRGVQRLLLLGVRNVFNITLYLSYLAALWLPPPKPIF